MKNIERIEDIENRVQALEDGVATTGYCQPAQGLGNQSYTIESDGKCIVDGGEIISINANTTLNPTYPIQSTYTNPNLITDWLEENGNPEIYAKVEADLIKKTDENLNSDDAKLSEVKQPDWGNLLSGDDLVEAYKDTNVLDSKIINRKIHKRIKPLLEENNSLHKEVISLEDKLELGNKVIAKLNSTFNDRLLDATRNAVEALQETQLELNEANERIAQLEALNKTYELSILNRQQPNQIEVPFKLDKYGDILLKGKVGKVYSIVNYCLENKIDQTKIERIILEMKSEVE